MKKYLLPLFALSFCSMTYAQNNFISEYFSDYETDPAFDKVNVTSKTFSMFTEIETKNEDERNAIAAITNLDGIKVLYQENPERVEALTLEAKGKIQGDARYEELVSVETKQENFLFMIREEKDIVQELTIIVGGDQKFLIATLYGEIDLKNISRLTTVIKNNGKEWFKVFENIDTEELIFNSGKKNNSSAEKRNQEGKGDMDINVYPNPVGSYVQLEATGLTDEEYELEFFSIIGEPIKNLGKVSLPYKVQLEDLPSGAYFLRLTNAEGVFKNFRIVKP